MLNQIITMSPSGNHEYITRRKDTINADPPDLLSALSKYYQFKRRTKQSKGYNNQKSPTLKQMP